MKKLTLIAITILLFNESSFAQTIEIGQSATSIKSMAEYEVSSYYSSKGVHSSTRTTNTKYNNGEISDVILCYGNQYVINFKMSVDFCRHYIMESGKLAYAYTQYENISFEKLKELYDQNYGDTKNGDLYYDNDFKHYSKIYLAKNGYPTVEWRITKDLDTNPWIISKKTSEAERKAIESTKSEEKTIAESEDVAYTLVEEMPTFPGGREELNKYIEKHLQYPKSAKDAGISGKCFVNFIIEKDGSISSIRILKGVPNCSECDTEALKLLGSMPKWNAGKQKDNNVRVFYNLPINFQANSK